MHTHAQAKREDDRGDIIHHGSRRDDRGEREKKPVECRINAYHLQTTAFSKSTRLNKTKKSLFRNRCVVYLTGYYLSFARLFFSSFFFVYLKLLFFCGLKILSVRVHRAFFCK